MKPRELDLCRPCAELLREAFTLIPVKKGIDMKVNCSNCKKRRFGATYAVMSKEKKEGTAK